jgi:3-hydroxyacyl-CoA dehydrogenase
VAVAIGDAIGTDVPERLRALVADGALGRKSGRGLYDHG